MDNIFSNFRDRFILLSLVWIFFCSWTPDAESQEKKWSANIQMVLDHTEPLTFQRGNRLPLYLWPAKNPGRLSDGEAEELVKLLNSRGIGLVCSWNNGQVDASVADAAPIARAQKKLGLRVNIDATSCLYSFFNGDPKTAHVDKEGKPFFDSSFGNGNIGCAFGLDTRREPIRNQIQPFVDKYQELGLPVDFIWVDWEVDGPIEWNESWSQAQRCVRCNKNIPQIDNFLAYQKSLREIRSDLQRDVYTNTILKAFPKALVGNYAVYPHNGYRYWLDYFEHYVEGQPALADQHARYRHWYNEYPLTGYTYANPVLYTWYSSYVTYDYKDTDWRWFYNLMLVASNAGQHTPAATPLISFVHWHTTAPPQNPDPSVQQFSEEKYQEMLWHALLRGHDSFFLWAIDREYQKEVELLHPVWSAAQEYGEFLEKGTPVSFDVPKQPGPVVSGLQLGKRVLVRRTDFTDTREPVKLRVGTSMVLVPRHPGKCTILHIE